MTMRSSRYLYQIILTSLVLIIFFPLTVVPQNIGRRVLLQVGDEKTTVDEFLQIYRKNKIQPDGPINPEALKEYLELFINFRLKVLEARQLGYDTVRQYIEELAGYRAQLAKPYLIDEETTESLVREAFERSREDVRASHILVKLDKNAPPSDTLEAYHRIVTLRNRILNGEDFNSVAVEASDDQSARDRMVSGRAIKGNRGDLGYFTVFDMIYPFESTAYGLNVGEISAPVRTDFGFHIIKLTERKPAMGRVQVAHIYFQFPPKSTSADSAAVLQEAETVHARLKEGAAFEEMASYFSDDHSTAQSGGLLDWFGANRMIPEFIEHTSKLTSSGQISPLFKSQFGYHIVKLIDQQKPGTFDEMAEELRERVKQNERSAVISNTFVEKIKNENRFRERKRNLIPLQYHLTDSLFSGTWTLPDGKEFNRLLFRIGDKRFVQRNLMEFIAKNQKTEAPIDLNIHLHNQYRQFVNETVIAYQDAQLEEKHPEFRMLMNEYRDGILLFNLTDDKIWSAAVRDTAGIERFFAEYRYNYMWGERADASVFTFNTTDTIIISKARQMAEQGIANDDILSAINTDRRVLTITRRKYQQGDSELVDAHDWTHYVKPLIEKNNQIHFVVIHNTLEPGPKELHEARGLIIADYQNYLDRRWVKELREKYPVKVNYELFSKIK